MTTQELIQKAASVLNSQKLGDGFYVGDVGCALISEDDQVFTGASIGANLSVCAEQSAVSQMVSKGKPRIKKIVAVWKDEKGELYVIPPCGRCREFLKMVDSDNLEADIILGPDHVVKLKELLPFAGWYAEKV